MAARTKPKPKATLHTWSVNIDGQVTAIEAADCVFIDAGTVAFYIGNTVVRAVGPAHWATVELVEPPDPRE